MRQLSRLEWIRTWRTFAAHAMRAQLAVPPSCIPNEPHMREQVAKRAAEMADIMVKELESRIPDPLPDPQ